MYRFANCVCLCLAFAVVFCAAISTASAAVIDVTWQYDGDGNWSSSSRWLPAIIPNNGTDTYNVFIDGDDPTGADVTVTLDMHVTIDNLQIESGNALIIDNGRTFRVADSTVNNMGTINMAAVGSSTYFNIDNPNGITLTGGGVLSLSDSTRNYVRDPAGADGWLTNEDNTIQGAGQLGHNTLGIINRGLIDANATNILLVNPRDANGGVTNSGTLRASVGSTLELQRGTYTNFEGASQGVIEAAGGVVALRYEPYIHGGRLVTSAGGVIRVVDSATLDSVANEGTFVVDNGQDGFLVGTINNSGIIRLDSTGGATNLFADGAVTLTGGGTVAMTGVTTNFIRDPSGGDGVLTNENNTIEGAGQLGENNLAVVNRGLIDANAASPMILNPRDGDGNFVNSGTLQASLGGTMILDGGVFTNYEGATAGVIEAADGIVQLRYSPHIKGGTLVTSGVGEIQVTDSATLEDLANEGIYRINNGHTTYLVGTINNTGTICLESSGNATDLYVDAAAGVTLTGGGTVTMSDSTPNYIRDPSGGDGLLINEDNTIEGAGQLCENSLAVVNRGIVDANASSSLIINPRDGDGNFINSGILRASAGGSLVLDGGVFTNYEGATPGVIEADNAVVTLRYTPHIKGGSLVSHGTGEFQVTSSAKLENLTVDATYRINNSQNTFLIGAINNTSAIHLDSSGNATNLFIDGASGVTLTGGGTVAMSNNIANFIRNAAGANGVLTNEDNTIEGAGQIGENTLAVINRGTIDANGSAGMTINPPNADLDGAGADMLNDVGGVLRAGGTGGISLIDGVFKNLGTIEALNGSNVTYSTTATTANNVAGVLTGGTWRAISTGTGARITLRGDSITHIAADTEVVLSGASASVQVDTTPLSVSLAANDGTLRILNGSGFVTVNAFTNNASGMIELDDAVAAFYGGLVNNGTVHLAEDASMFLVGDFSGTNGTVGPGTVHAEGAFAPGDGGTAVLGFGGDLEVHGSATLAIEIGGTALGEFDRLEVAGALSLDGTLDVVLTNSFVPELGDVFDLFDFDTIAGAFDTMVLPGLDPWLRWDTDDLYVTGELAVTYLTTPGDANLDGYVNQTDAEALAAGWGEPGGWANGDFNLDGVVDMLDASIMAANWGASPSESCDVPEPGMGVLLLAFVVFLVRRGRGRG